MKLRTLLYLPCILLLAQCNQPDNTTTHTEKKDSTTQSEQPVAKRVDMTYTFLGGKDSVKKIRSRYTGNDLYMLALVNRTDTAHVAALDTLIIPADLKAERMQYFPFPFKVDGLKDVRKIVLFSYPAQVFAAYDHGRLVYTGPTNMGRQKDQTPTGLFFANWKAEETKSTFNDEWELKWNFNIQNKEGIGWHEYAMPGYPASHSCLRLTEDDAKQLYNWADQWVLEGTDNIKAPGTPVIVFGSYPFGSRKPWLALGNDPHALDISEEQVMAEVQPHINEIMEAQRKQDAVAGAK